ncbi:MAG TPA: hypothetical protein VND89_06635 [Acidimicrobiales bacterium]|nr:hypothetical protein [Acidimicrobiales bacterium]
MQSQKAARGVEVNVSFIADRARVTEPRSSATSDTQLGPVAAFGDLGTSAVLLDEFLLARESDADARAIVSGAVPAGMIGDGTEWGAMVVVLFSRHGPGRRSAFCGGTRQNVFASTRFPSLLAESPPGND